MIEYYGTRLSLSIKKVSK